MGAQPQHARAVLKHYVDPIVDQAAGICLIVSIANETMAIGSPLAQPGFGANPQRARMVFADREQLSLAQALRISRVVLHPLERTGQSIKQIQTACRCADPDSTATILVQHLYVIVTQTGGVTAPISVRNKSASHAIKTRQASAVSAKP